MKTLWFAGSVLCVTSCFKSKIEATHTVSQSVSESSTEEIDPEDDFNRPVTVDQAALEALGGGFGVNRATSKIYYLGRELLNADLASFQVLADRYAKDKNRVYVDFTRVKDADPSTFEYLKGQLAKDKNHVYYLSGVLYDVTDVRQLEADAATFVEVKPPRPPQPYPLDPIQDAYFKDKNTVWAGNGRNLANSDYLGVPVDPATFVYYGGPFFSANGKVYVSSREELNVDPSTFAFVECHYLSYSLTSPSSMPISCSATSNGQTIVREL